MILSFLETDNQLNWIEVNLLYTLKT